MRVLVTGDQGRIGCVVAEALADAGHEVAGFDIADGDDVLDAAAVKRAAQGCRAIVHLAAIPSDSSDTPERIMATNVLGTWHVLLAAEANRIRRVVNMSSGQVLGVAEGERAPDYLPLDDSHARRAHRPYGLSKRLGEDLCAAATSRTSVTTVCLRPVAVWTAEHYRQVEERRRADRSTEWEPYWEYGAFVDVRDVAAAVVAALERPAGGHLRALLCASDISASAPGRELAERLLPQAEWRGGSDYESDPWRALVDCTVAREVLGWRPRHRWDKRGR